MKILVVDDSVILRNNLKRFIDELGYETVGEAKNGLEAIDKTKELNPDLITMDITMDDMDGITAVKNIKEFDDRVKIIMVTSHTQETMVVESLQAGAKGYITKPITKEKLQKTIETVFGIDSSDVDSQLDDDFLDD